MRKVVLWLAWFVVILGIAVMYRECSTPPPLTVVRYKCIITVHDEILCFEPGPSGAMFRPEKRFDEFVLEVPVKGKNK